MIREIATREIRVRMADMDEDMDLQLWLYANDAPVDTRTVRSLERLVKAKSDRAPRPDDGDVTGAYDVAELDRLLEECRG